MTRTLNKTSVPVIAVAGDIRPGESYRWHATPEPYVRAIAEGLGGLPLILPPLGAAIDVDTLFARVDGLLLPGSRSNVHPTLYGAEPTQAAEPYDPDRDATTLPLIRAAIDRGLPLFAICRGMQELNVALGGTLVPEVHVLEGRDDHRAPEADLADDRFAIRHDIHLTEGGCLARILKADTVRVNSLHFQAVGRLSERLTIEATAPDGTIEAVSVKDAPGYAVGVQWHPEYWVRSDLPSARLFQAFGAAVRAHMRGEASWAAVA